MTLLQASTKARTDPKLALKNADSLLHDVLKTVDTSGDGQIQYNGSLLSASTRRTVADWYQNSEFSLIVLNENSGHYSKASIEITMAKLTKMKCVLLSRVLASRYPMRNSTNSSNRWIQMTTM